MNTDLIILILIVLIILLFIAVEKWELKQFKITEYIVPSDKVSDTVRVSIVADLHDHIYGVNNQPLFDALRQSKPDLILIPGDLFTERKVTDTSIALKFLKEAVKIAPVYYSNGNHETRLQETPEGKEIWEKFQKEAEALGVHFVNNRTELVSAAGLKVLISGYECDMRLYAKGKRNDPEPGEVVERIHLLNAEPQSNPPEHLHSFFHILLAHNPIFFDEYRKTGADLTVSGHMHGGLVRIPGIGSVISPQFKLFPKYDAGMFTEEGQHLIISKGMGTHTFNIRVFNRAELVNVRIEKQVTTDNIKTK